jgi:hypothetical protein
MSASAPKDEVCLGGGRTPLPAVDCVLSSLDGAYLGRDAVREGMELLDSISGPTEIRTRVSAVRGQRPWPLDDGALPLEQFPGQGFEPRFYGPEPHVLPVGRPRSDRRRRMPGTRQPQLVGKASVNIISFFHSSRYRTRKDQQPSCSR